MERRKEIIEEAAPRLVLSIHQNYYPSKSVRGGHVFYNGENEQSKRLAGCLQEHINTLYEQAGVMARTEKKGEYYMLECTSYPSVIIECGFLSNPNDEKLLLTAAWRKKLSETIARGIMAYLAGNTA
jgi:N-acetylmuramoyl-L-alanine amidase